MELPGEVRLVADNRIEAGTIEYHVRFFSPLCSCKLRLRRASPTVGLPSGHRALLGLRRLHAGGAKTCSYEYRFAEHEHEHEHEYEYDEIRCDART